MKWDDRNLEYRRRQLEQRERSLVFQMLLALVRR